MHSIRANRVSESLQLEHLVPGLNLFAEAAPSHFVENNLIRPGLGLEIGRPGW